MRSTTVSFVRIVLAVAFVLSSSAAFADFGIGKSSKTTNENSTPLFHKASKDAPESDNVEKSTQEKERGFNVSVGDEKKTQDGNYTKTESRGLDFGKSEKPTTTATDSTKPGNGEKENSYSIEGKLQTEHRRDGELNPHVKGSATVDYGVKGKGTVSKEGAEFEGEVGVHGKLEGTATTDTWGDDQNNLTIEGKGYIEAEIAAKATAAIKANQKEISARLKGEAGVSVGVGGEISTNMTIMGVPVDVKFAGSASAGAKVKGEIAAGINRETGKFFFVMEAGAVLGAGAEGSVTVEVGMKELLQLANDVGGKILDKTLSKFSDYDPEYLQQLLSAGPLSEKIELIIRHELAKHPEWNNPAGEQLLDNLLQMINKGADFPTVYQYVQELMKNNIAKANEILQTIRQQIQNGSNNDEDPFNSMPSNNGDGSGTSEHFQGLKPIKLIR